LKSRFSVSASQLSRIKSNALTSEAEILSRQGWRDLIAESFEQTKQEEAEQFISSYVELRISFSINEVKLKIPSQNIYK